jgi:Flp pilus assembly secretin CpaC
MKPLLAILLAFASGAVSVWSADPATEPRTPDIRLEMQVVAVPVSIGYTLAGEMKSKDKIEAAYTRVQELLATGTAKLIGWPILTTRSGQRAIYEDIEEIRYATEYHPPTVGVAPDVSTNAPIKVHPTVDVTTFDGVPAAFETRNAGVTLEVEPILSADGKTIDLNIVPQHVRLKGYRKATIEGAARKGKVVVEQPIFDTKKVTTSFSMRNGQRVLLGVFPTDEPTNHLELFILKAEVIPAE